MTGIPQGAESRASRRRVLASDLDRTLVHSAARLARGEDAAVVEVYQGRGITVARPATLRALGALAGASAFVPVTTRSHEQLARITPIWELAREGWAICANGATLLNHGSVDRAWQRTIDALCAGCAPLHEVRATVEAQLGAPHTTSWMPLLRACDDRFLYCTLVLDAAPPQLEAVAGAVLEPLGWHAVLHGRKLYMLPRGLCKGRAARHLRDRLGTVELMAAGDSVLDLELLLAAEHRWVPADAELVEMGLVPGGARVTRAGHVGAGQEIAEAAWQWVQHELR